MKSCNPENVRAFILGLHEERLRSMDVAPAAVPDDFDLLAEGVIDSLGVLELISTIEDEFGVLIDLEAIDAENLTILGPLSDYIGRTAQPKLPATHPVAAGAAQPKLPTIKVRLGGGELTAEMATTPEQVDAGLQFRESLGADEAMLFVFPAPQWGSFWMKDCGIPLSIAFIGADGLILEMHDLQPHDTEWVRSRADNVRFALEAPQGWFRRHDVSAGAAVTTERGSLAEVFPALQAQF